MDTKSIVDTIMELQKKHGAKTKDSSFSFGRDYQKFRKKCRWSDPVTHTHYEQLLP